MSEHPSLKVTKKQEVKQKPDVISETLAKIQEQLQHLSNPTLSGILETLTSVAQMVGDIQTDLAEFREVWKKKEELLDTELRIARLFEAMLQKDAEKVE